MSTPRIARIANRYDIIEKLGQGGMGAVFRAYDRLAGQEVALKQVLLSPGQLDFASKAGTDDTDKLRLSLAREFAILAGLRHPHILSVLDYGFDAQRQPFYTMTLLENGQDFRTYAGEQPEEARYDLIAQMLQALHYLHRRGVLHRDLKPDNVFVTPDGSVKVMDFGLAKADKQRSSTDKDGISGTISYMSPELFQGVAASVASDLYALGVMAYEILIGRYPYTYENVGTLIMQIMMQEVSYDDAPEEIADWLAQLLAKDPAGRFLSAYDALSALYTALDQDIPPESQAIRESFLQASTFVGREAELRQLTEALDGIENENAFFLVGGESGVGKSRLLDELRVQTLVRGVTVLRGQAVEGGGLPFQVWREVVRRLLLMVEVTDLQAGILKDIVPDIDTLLDKAIPNAPELTGKAYQDRIMLNIVDLFRQLTRPVVLLLEDLQWTGESLAVLEQMLKVPEQLSQLMVVANYRDDEAPDLPEKLASMTHIKLERLTQDAVSELSSAMLGDVGMNEEVVELLHSQSEGNLFFLVETVRALAEASGDLQRIGQGELPEGVFTGGMQALMRRRLSKVDAQYSDIQTFAAIIGREIDTQLLAHAHNEASVGRWLSNAAEYGVVDIQDNTWRFAHDKLREALIADIPEDKKPNIHRTAAETIEAVYPDDAGYNEALLAHWQQVGDFDKTYHYTLPVAKHMIEITGTYAKAENLLQSLLDHLPIDDTRRVPTLNWLAENARRLNNIKAAKTYATQARQLATTHDNLHELVNGLLNLGRIADQQGEYERAAEFYQQGLALSQELGDQPVILTVLSNMGIIADKQGEYERATEFYQQGLALSQELGGKRDFVMCLINFGITLIHQGKYERATDLFQQSLAIIQQLGDQRALEVCLGNLGELAFAQGEYERAIDLFQQSLAVSRRLGSQISIVMNLTNLGYVASAQGEYERAKGLFEESLASGQKSDDPLGITYNFIGLGWVAFEQGQTQAIHWFSQALKTAHAIGATPEVLRAVVGFAGWLTQQGQAERAAQVVGLAQQHSAQNSVVRKSLDEVMPQLEAALSPDELQAALDHGASLDLDTVVAELLAEFGQHGDNEGDDDKQEE